MTRQRFIQLAAATAAAGGAAWVAKFAVLVAIDGDDSALVAALYLLGATLMAVGASWVLVRIAGDRPFPVVVGLALLAPILFFASYALIDAVAKPLAGDAGPGWLADEVGIVLTGLAWLTASLVRPSDSLAVVPWRSRRPSTTR
jgi:hypothetical protein